MGENGLIDRSGCTLKMEPLASVRQLERFLLKMVAKQWYGQKDMILFLILIIFFQSSNSDQLLIEKSSTSRKWQRMFPIRCSSSVRVS